MNAPLSRPDSTANFVASDGYPLPLEGLQGIDYAAALFMHSARLYPFAPGYLQSQFNELTGRCRRSHLNQLALSCLLLSQQQQSGKDPHLTLAMLANHPLYQQAAEFVARAFINNRYLQRMRQALTALDSAEMTAAIGNWSLPFTLHDNSRPVPASLMRALLQWPQNDKLFTQALNILQHQPALAALVCRYATAYTPQGKQLELKPSLLLLGPQRSRELVLLAHFESNLSKPVFPLRGTLLKRRTLIQHTLNQLAHTFAVALPCRAELIAWLLVYDAWRSPRWTSCRQLPTTPPQQPWRVNSWLSDSPPGNHPLGNSSVAHHRVALRLCQYWHMPSALSDALRLEHQDPKVNALISLSIASVYVIQNVQNIHLENDGNQHIDDLLSPWLQALDEPGAEPVLRRYLHTVTRAAIDARYSSELAGGMRP